MRGSVAVPGVLPASEISATGFCANWEAVDDATEYVVELEEVVEASEGSGESVTLLSETFVGCTKANQSLSNLDSYLSSPGWTGSNLYGESGVLRVGASKSAGTIRTPKLNAGGAVTVTFSMAYYSTSDSGSILTVSLMNASGAVVESFDYSATTQWVNKELEFDATGDFYIEFSTKNSTNKKRVSIDNVTITYTSNISATLVERVTTEETSYVFTALKPLTQYRYRVYASDGYGSSDFSKYASVTTTSYAKGDINGDSTVDVADITILVSYILSSSDSELSISDVDLNGDGACDIADITMLVSLILGTEN
jgi:hypothetical protein